METPQNLGRNRQPQSPSMTLNGRSILLAEINKNSGACQKNFNEHRRILLAAKCRPVIVVSKNIKYVRIYVSYTHKLTEITHTSERLQSYVSRGQAVGRDQRVYEKPFLQRISIACDN